MPSDQETHEYIVVHDGIPPSSSTNNIESTSSPTSLNNTPSVDRDGASQRRRSGRPGDSLDRLRALPPIREIPWYGGKELPTEKATESSRVQTRGACLLASRGEVKDPPCTHCATGVGRFAQCIALDDWFHGACATCQLATRGNLCSLRKKDTLRIKPESESKQQESDVLHSIPAKETPTRIEPRLEPKPRSQDARASRTPLPADVETASKKRKRETLQGTSVWKPYVSPYLPAMPANSIQTTLPSTPTLYSSLNTTLPTTHLAHSEDIPLNYIYRKENLENGSKRPSVLVKPHLSKDMALQINDSFAPRPDPELDREDRDGIRGREATDSLSPSAQLLQPFHSAVEEKPHVQGFVAVNANSKPAPPPETPLIDTLPRKKQKQIYGIIGGLQSGIRSCKLQAQSMQKQLDLLQAALGIDTDDDNDISIIE